MSIFDHFVAKTANESEQKAASPMSYRKLSSALDAAGEEATAENPNSSETVADFVSSLKEICKTRYKKSSGPQPIKAAAQFFLSKDRMTAYACLLPPEYGGTAITLEEFLEEMHCEGINHGILQKEIQQALERGYLYIFPAARGTPPQAGEDGKVTELFPRCENLWLDAQDGQVDFSQDIQIQPIRKGAPICRIQPLVEGRDGSDVTGQVLPYPQLNSVFIPQGENTAVTEDGQALVAGADGILYTKGDLFCVQEQEIIEGDLNGFQEPLKISGNLYIQGDVDGGTVVEASGDIVINGKVREARMTSVGGTIRVQRGVYGTEGKTFLSAARQVQSPVLEQVELNAGTSIIAEMISNSTIHCNGTVYAMTGRGLIAGSLIRAGDSILCLQIGNLAGSRSHFSVGYPPHSPESWDQLKTQLAEAKSTIKKLWTNINDLRKKGSRISDMEKMVLDQLVEQRNLYLERQEALAAELSILNEVLSKKSSGRIRCEKLYPPLEIQIGKLMQEITSAEENCNIRAVDNWILLK